MAEEKVVHSGYLMHRPGGALGRWKKKKHYWCQLDEVTCQLRLYKSHVELCHTVGMVDIHDACISLLPDHSNHILVACRGKEHILIAENHRCMMQWLQNLQEVRDLFSCLKSNRNRVRFSKMLTYKSTTQSAPSKGLASSPASSFKRPLSVRGRSKKLSDLPASGETNDNYATFKKDLVGSQSSPSSKTSFVYDSMETSPTSLRSCNSIASQSSTEELHVPVSPGWTSAAGGQGTMDASDQSEQGASYGEHLEAKLEGAAVENDDEAETWGQMDKEALIEKLKQMKEHNEESKKSFKSLENREQAYKQMLKKREQDIMHLDDKIGIMEQAHHLKRNLLSSEDMDAAQQRFMDLQDTCKVYQEQNGFLNTEVRRQASLRRREQSKLDSQNGFINSLECSVVQSRQDYFQLLSQVIEVTSLDLKEEIPLQLSWEELKFKRFLELYDESRLQDPLLPDPRRVMVDGCNDIYGFQHPINNQPLLFHYLCQILQDHLLASSRKSTELGKRWEELVNTNGHVLTIKQEDLRDLVYDGIPTDYRSEVWSLLVMQRVKHLKAEKCEDYFQWLCNRIGTSSAVDKYRRQIELDLLRTMPHNVHFNSKEAEGVKQLRKILEAFCVHNPAVGYCQGMNFIAGTCLLFMDVETAFWCMVAVVESYFPANYFDTSLIGAQADQNILKDILELRLPRLHAHLDDVGIEMCSFTLNWFLAIFFDVVPFTMLLRIWDCFLFDGLRVLFQFSIALLQYHETSLLQKKDILAILKDTKSMAKLTQDVHAIVSIVRESNDSFPSTAWIQQRQEHYMKILRVVYEQQEKAREEFERQEGLTPTTPLVTSKDDNSIDHDLKMDCAVECYPGNLVVCRGELRQGWVGRVDISKCIKQNYGIRVDNRIVCLTMAGIDMALLGTISNFLCAFSVGTQEELWFEKLRDTPLSIVYDPQTRNVYIGLADGTLAVIEGVCHASPRDIFYHAIGASYVRSVLFVPQLDQIWCACGNSINILNNSLNIIDGFEIAKSPDIHISGLYLSDHGVWITVRGSAVVMLWDIRQIRCILLHDTSADQTPIIEKPRDNPSKTKITSLLPYKDTVWVGTADGYLTIYKTNKAVTLETCLPLANGEQNQTEDSEESDIDLKKDGRIEDEQMAETEEVEEVEEVEDGEDDEDGDEDGDEEKPQDTSSQTLKEFVVVVTSKGLPESCPGSDTDTKTKSQMHLPLLAKVHDTVGSVTSSDDEYKPQGRTVRKHRKGSRTGPKSPRTLRKLWYARQKSAERQEGELSPRSSKTMEKVQSMFGKFTLGSTQKSKQYRYSRELREETRRGSRICLRDTNEPSISAMSLTSLVDAESSLLRPQSLLSRNSVEDVYTKYASRPRPPLFDASGIDVHPGYELDIEAKRKISDHQVRCLVLTSLEDGEPAIVSCAGFYGDDESILRWTCHIRENVWMQVPIEDTTT